MTKQSLLQGCKADSIFKIQLSKIYCINKLKKKNYIITSIDTENTFYKIQYLFMINSWKIRIDGNLLNLRRNVYQNLIANVILSGTRLDAFPLRLRARQRCPLSSLLFNIMLQILASTITQEKEIKGIQIRKKKFFFNFPCLQMT